MKNSNPVLINGEWVQSWQRNHPAYKPIPPCQEYNWPIQHPKKPKSETSKFLTVVACLLLAFWFADYHQHYLEREIKWMEKQGYSEEEIQATLEDEYSDSVPSLENYSPE